MTSANLWCKECVSFIIYPEGYKGECPRCIMLEQVRELRAELALPYNREFHSITYILGKLDDILEYKVFPNPYSADGSWPHLNRD